jgi:hypothetical protein
MTTFCYEEINLKAPDPGTYQNKETGVIYQAGTNHHGIWNEEVLLLYFGR